MGLACEGARTFSSTELPGGRVQGGSTHRARVTCTSQNFADSPNGDLTALGQCVVCLCAVRNICIRIPWEVHQNCGPLDPSTDPLDQIRRIESLEAEFTSSPNPNQWFENHWMRASEVSSPERSWFLLLVGKQVTKSSAPETGLTRGQRCPYQALRNMHEAGGR